MLQVFTQENTLPNRKKPFVFKSRNADTIDEEQIVKRIAGAGTTITAADTKAVLAVLEKVFWELINSGYVVKLFMGSFRAGAAGSADSANEIFKPKKVKYKGAPERDHKLSLLFESDRKKEKDLCNTVKIERIKNHGFCNPCIHNIQNYGDKSRITFAQKDLVLLSGDFIKIDTKDSEQGVFITSKGITKQAAVYLHNSRSKLIFQLPPELPEGTYSITVKTNRTGVLHTSNVYQIIIEG